MAKPLPHSQPLQQFLKYFDAHAEPSHRKFQRVVNHPIDWYNEDSDTDFNIAGYSRRVEEVEAVAIHIPIYKLEDFLASIPEEKYREMEIRMAVPAVKKAYEQYRMLLKMCGGDFGAGY